MPRRLSGRIALAFGVLALATLLAVGAALFVRLRAAHEEANTAALAQSATRIVADLRLQPGSWESTLTSAQEQLREDDPEAFVAANLRANGAIAPLDGGTLPFAVPQTDASSSQGSGRVRGSDGRFWAYVVFHRGDAAQTRSAILATPDRSVAQALGDLLRTLPAVFVALLVVGAPIAWLLSRSVTLPLRRLASAAGAVPGSAGSSRSTGSAGSADPAGFPLRVEGPQEVRDLTVGFNAMAAELAETRAREAQMLADLRHDLRTPLTSIAGFAEAIVDGTATGETATTAAARIVEEAERLDRLVGELGLIERLRGGPSALRPEALDAAEVLESTRARFVRRAESAGVSLEVLAQPDEARDGGPLTLVADRLGLERILQNLVENALAAVPAGSRIVLRADPIETPDRRPAVAFSVADDGPGFAPGTLDRVFERFYRGDPARSKGGSGLGLSIVREIAEAHGGRAWAENLAPHGARVVVALPNVPPAAAPAPVDAR